jgi:signal transduction histidine kinase
VFDGLARAAAKLMGTPMALVTLLDETRQWFKARCGLDLPETPRSWAFCDHAIRADATLLVPDAKDDVRFAENPLVLGHPHIRFYCGVPLRTPQGHCLGTLCALDHEPRRPAEELVSTLEGLAHYVETELELRRRLQLVERELLTAKRDQLDQGALAAMIVHDLRNPLTAVSLLAHAIEPADEHSGYAVEELICSAERARRMLADVLDVFLHQSRRLQLRPSVFPLVTAASAVKRRLAPLARAAGKTITVPPSAPEPLVRADAEIVGRVIENLVANAIQHGGAGEEISVEVSARDDRCLCAVRDRGTTIPEEARGAVFGFGVQAGEHAMHRGHGLGLAFCRLAVEAHGGTISVSPNDGGRGNCFSFDLPLAS